MNAQPKPSREQHASPSGVDYQPGPISEFDKLMTMASAAEALGLPYHTVQRAAARKLIPTYRLGDSKKYVRLRDILNRIEHPAP